MQVQAPPLRSRKRFTTQPLWADEESLETKDFRSWFTKWKKPGKRGGRDGRNEEKREENGREVQGKNIEVNHTREGKENTRGQDARREESFRAFACFHTCYWSLVP